MRVNSRLKINDTPSVCLSTLHTLKENETQSRLVSPNSPLNVI